MKLILKDKQEISITYMNNTVTFNTANDYNNETDTVSFYIRNGETTVDEILSKINKENMDGFKLAFDGDGVKEFPGYEFKRVIEEITDEKQIIYIVIGK